MVYAVVEARKATIFFGNDVAKFDVLLRLSTYQPK
jgi:hypothetical protein